MNAYKIGIYRPYGTLNPAVYTVERNTGLPRNEIIAKCTTLQHATLISDALNEYAHVKR